MILNPLSLSADINNLQYKSLDSNLNTTNIQKKTQLSSHNISEVNKEIYSRNVEINKSLYTKASKESDNETFEVTIVDMSVLPQSIELENNLLTQVTQ